jgi:hypothetical protein
MDLFIAFVVGVLFGAAAVYILIDQKVIVKK